MKVEVPQVTTAQCLNLTGYTR